MDVRFTAGEFAKLCGISRQTLIFYDKEGVIKPKFKDSRNGYRYYTADQLEQLDTIMILREIGLSLSEIREHMKNRSLENSLQIFESQRREIHQKIADLKTIERRIDRKMESLQMFCRQDQAFCIKTLPEQLLAVSEVQEPGGLLEVDIALKQLMKQVKNRGVDHFYQVGDTVPKECLEAGEFLRFRWAFLPVEKSRTGAGVLRKPAGDYAVQCHFGPYTTAGNTYRSMLTEIKRRGRSITGDAYEFCVLDSLTTSSPEHYCTQIQIPVDGPETE